MTVLSIADSKGKVIHVVRTSSDDVIKTIKKGLYKEQIINGETHYINPLTKEVEERPEQATKLNEDTLTLTNLPTSGDIFINDVKYSFNETTIELDLSKGKYTILVVAFPFKDKFYEISV